MYNQTALAYQKTQQATASPRELEAALLLRAAARLQAVIDGWDNGTDDLRDALLFNRKLWTVLATSATAAESPLPHPVKQNIGNIAVFIFNRTIDLMEAPRPEKVGALVSINANIAAGLRGSPA